MNRGGEPGPSAASPMDPLAIPPELAPMTTPTPEPGGYGRRIHAPDSDLKAPPPLSAAGPSAPAKIGTNLYDVRWTAEEQAVLEHGLAVFSPERYTSLWRYIKIAANLPAKGVRDVALRVRWMTKRGGGAGSKKRARGAAAAETAAAAAARKGKGRASATNGTGTNAAANGTGKGTGGGMVDGMVAGMPGGMPGGMRHHATLAAGGNGVIVGGGGRGGGMGTGQIMNQPGTMGFVPMPSGVAMGAGFGHHPAMIRGGAVDVGPGGQRHPPGTMMHPGYPHPYPVQGHSVGGMMMVPGGAHQMMPPPGAHHAPGGHPGGHRGAGPRGAMPPPPPHPRGAQMAPTAHAVMLPHLEEHGGAGIYRAPGGVSSDVAELLSENVGIVSRIRDNLNRMDIADNVQLLASLRDNIMAVSDDMRAAPGIMQQMPQLPLTIDLNLAAAVLPPRMPPRRRTAAAAAAGGGSGGKAAGGGRSGGRGGGRATARGGGRGRGRGRGKK